MLNYGGCWVGDSQGHSGGLVLFRKKEGGCVVKGTCYIDFEVEGEHIVRSVHGNYRCPERMRRRESWGLIRNLTEKSGLP